MRRHIDETIHLNVTGVFRLEAINHIVTLDT